MASIWLILGVTCVIYLFWLDRQAAESAREYANRHSKQLNVQFLSIACIKKRVGILKTGKPGLKSSFAWEFSSNGQDSYTGVVHLENDKIVSVDVPPHKLS